MCRFVYLNIIVFLFISSVLSAQSNNGFLRRQNTSFVNNTGSVKLVGANIGNWLHLEGYMMGHQIIVTKKCIVKLAR